MQRLHKLVTCTRILLFMPLIFFLLITIIRVSYLFVMQREDMYRIRCTRIEDLWHVHVSKTCGMCTYRRLVACTRIEDLCYVHVSKTCGMYTYRRLVVSARIKDFWQCTRIEDFRHVHVHVLMTCGMCTYRRLVACARIEISDQ